MPAAIQGKDGKVLRGTVPLVWMQSWDATMGQDTETLGPFLNDGGNLYKTRTSKSIKGSFKGVVPSGKDASQTSLIGDLTGGVDAAISLISNTGYTIVIGTALITEIKLGHDAKGSATFEGSFEDSGGFTVT